MKYLILFMALFSSMSLAATSHFQTPIRYGGVDNLDAWHLTPDAFVPITIRHFGSETSYYIEVNNQQVTDVFLMDGEDILTVDVPVTLENRHGAQMFKVCSVALHGSLGSRICTKAELFLIEATK